MLLDIVITCLPDNFNEDDKVYDDSSFNFVERVTRRVQRNSWRIQSRFDLATIIVESCTASGSESGDSGPEIFPFLDCFYQSIREVV
jgi:hypothetical protein